MLIDFSALVHEIKRSHDPSVNPHINQADVSFIEQTTNIEEEQCYKSMKRHPL